MFEPLSFSSSGAGGAQATQKVEKFGDTDQRNWTILYVLLALAVPLLYVYLTNQIWEDCLITFRHSRNFVEGHGLVFNINRPQKVQGFTSCLNVMLLALYYAVGGHTFETAVNLYRATCLAVYVWGGLILLRLMMRDGVSDRLTPMVFIGLYVTEAKTVAYTMNGQESAFMVAFLALGFYAVYKGLGRSWRYAAASWTGLLYTRPDAPVYIAALIFAGLVFNIENRRQVWMGIVKAGATAAVLFAPWFISVWVYYGWPIPNTVTAKSSLNPGHILSPAWTLRLVLSKFPSTQTLIFEPINAMFGGWPRPPLDTYDMLCWLICNCYWMIPSRDRLGRIASLMFTLTALYMSFIDSVGTASSWYVPSVTVFGTFVMARTVMELVKRLPGLRRWPVTSTRLVQLVIVGMSILLMIGETMEMRVQQHVVEDQGRKRVGLYLHDVAKPDQRIYLEPLGYIGYYSDRYIFDFPGLVTPEVVRLHHEQQTNQISTIPELMPEWLVMRPSELRVAFQIPKVRDNYTAVREFNVQPQLNAAGYFPGAGYVYIDSIFYVLKRNDVVPASNVSRSPYGQ